MKRYTYLVLLTGLFLLVACSNKVEERSETGGSSAQAKLTKTQVFEVPLENGNKQLQTVIYKDNKIQRIVLKNPLSMTEEIEASINEVGVTETKQRIEASMGQDEVYQQLSTVAGLSYVLDLTQERELTLTFTLDVPNLDVSALNKTDYFKGSGLDGSKMMTAEQYIDRLKAYGASDVTNTDKQGDNLFSLPKD